MHLERYAFGIDPDSLEYEFYSEGPRGKVKKIIRFQRVSDDPPGYNLAFGDIDPETGQIDDFQITNNRDREKILNTVLNTVADFLEQYPDAMIIAQGSTPARTRLYQMKITAVYETLCERYYLYGLAGEQWELFTKNKPYNAIGIERKDHNFYYIHLQNNPHGS